MDMVISRIVLNFIVIKLRQSTHLCSKGKRISVSHLNCHRLVFQETDTEMDICVWKSFLREHSQEQCLQRREGNRIGLKEKLYSGVVAAEASADLTGSSGNFINFLYWGKGTEPLNPNFDQSLDANSLCITLGKVAPFGGQYLLERYYAAVGYQLATQGGTLQPLPLQSDALLRVFKIQLSSDCVN